MTHHKNCPSSSTASRSKEKKDILPFEGHLANGSHVIFLKYDFFIVQPSDYPLKLFYFDEPISGGLRQGRETTL